MVNYQKLVVWYRYGCFVDQFKMEMLNKVFTVLCDTNYIVCNEYY